MKDSYQIRMNAKFNLYTTTSAVTADHTESALLTEEWGNERHRQK